MQTLTEFTATGLVRVTKFHQFTWAGIVIMLFVYGIAEPQPESPITFTAKNGGGLTSCQRQPVSCRENVIEPCVAIYFMEKQF